MLILTSPPKSWEGFMWGLPLIILKGMFRSSIFLLISSRDLRLCWLLRLLTVCQDIFRFSLHKLGSLGEALSWGLLSSAVLPQVSDVLKCAGWGSWAVFDNSIVVSANFLCLGVWSKKQSSFRGAHILPAFNFVTLSAEAIRSIWVQNALPCHWFLWTMPQGPKNADG